jgi:hypothetical protein
MVILRFLIIIRRMFDHRHQLHHHTFTDQRIYFLDLSDGSDDSKLGLQDGLNENEEAVEERMKLKRKLQRNRTSFTQEQIDALEEGIFTTTKKRFYSTILF